MLAAWCLLATWLASIEFISDFSEIFSIVGSHFVFNFVAIPLILFSNFAFFVCLHTNTSLRFGFRLGLVYGFAIWTYWISTSFLDSSHLILSLENTSSEVVILIPNSDMAAKDDDSVSVLSDVSVKSKKVCDGCRKVLAMGDPHSMCCTCLGPSHDMLDCVLCQGLPYAQKIMRARRIAHWCQQGTEACPSINSITKILANAEVPDHLLIQNIRPYCILQKNSKEGTQSVEEGEDDDHDHDSEQECGDALLHGD